MALCRTNKKKVCRKKKKRGRRIEGDVGEKSEDPPENDKKSGSRGEAGLPMKMRS